MGELEKKREQIREAMVYAVADEKRSLAEDVLDIYREDKIALDLLHEFYSFLPEARDLWVREIRVVARSRGIFLFAAIAEDDGYLYLLSSEGIEFQGSLSQGYLSRELLDFFNFESAGSFKVFCEDPSKLELYEPLQLDTDTCPACHALTGELHELGCPVEVCPWCGGQLIQCDCRFEKLGLDAMTTEQELVQFEQLLEERGRIAYSSEQRPFFADEGPGVAFD